MEDGRTDAEVARDRLLAELERTEDVETRLSLWRAAKRYNQRGREAREGRDVPRASLPRLGALSGARGFEW